MRKIAAIALSLTVFMGGGTAAFAQHRHEDRDRDDRRHEEYREHDRHQEWREGHRMDRHDWERGRRFDYGDYRLREPPRGYEWREIDGRFVLGAIATGIIADIVINAR
ncbi:MAG: RcnB family protein [Rhodospirillales bacterium]|jgi:Ni/Co efflux regulator RcnB